MSGSVEGRRAGLVAEIARGWFGRLFIRTVIEPSPKMRRWRAPKKIRPGNQVPPTVLDRFHATNRAIREFVQRARNYDVNRIRFKNPFVRIIRFTVGTGLEVLWRHERRHLLQAERIRAALDATDRKSTRLNSSHSQISYAVFCLKKKIAGTAKLASPRPIPRRG